ncbi:hypothetical protein Anapl_08753 [Anas platyrhynchos]|uniref:Uncharacterized protein n=1 Tax=Anas platyrhynchos TaxID=8839 RepID=R0JSV2_ANAPL|nr:hypothetical protein Anapl_08753 [Anas platyrhynchos]
MIRSDLPRGWEEGFSEEGASYFIDSAGAETVFSGLCWLTGRENFQ